MGKTHGGFIDTEVVAGLVTEGVPTNLVFTALAEIDNTLKGVAGSKVTYPVYEYIGRAGEVAPGEAIPLKNVQSKVREAVVKKAAQGVPVFDEDVNNAVGDPVGIASDQISASLADRVNIDLKNALDGAIQTSASVNSVDTLQNALDIFPVDNKAKYVIFLNRKDGAALRADAGNTFLSGTELGANRFVEGVFGDVLGVQIIVTDDVEEGDFYLVKEGALKLVIKQEVEIEQDRVAGNGKTDIYGSIHYTAFLKRPDWVVKSLGK